jgi:hypothetical protein
VVTLNKQSNLQTPRTLGLKTLGFFVFRTKEKMNLEDFKKQRNAKVLGEHELDEDALEQLIEEKFKRARAYHQAFHNRGDELVEQD